MSISTDRESINNSFPLDCYYIPTINDYRNGSCQVRAQLAQEVFNGKSVLTHGNQNKEILDEMKGIEKLETHKGRLHLSHITYHFKSSNTDRSVYIEAVLELKESVDWRENFNTRKIVERLHLASSYAPACAALAAFYLTGSEGFEKNLELGYYYSIKFKTLTNNEDADRVSTVFRNIIEHNPIPADRTLESLQNGALEKSGIPVLELINSQIKDINYWNSNADEPFYQYSKKYFNFYKNEHIDDIKDNVEYLLHNSKNRKLSENELDALSKAAHLIYLHANRHNWNWGKSDTSDNHQYAFELWKIAAQADHIKSKYYLGLIYLTGKVSDKKNDLGRTYLTEAAQNDVKEAQEMLDHLDEKKTLNYDRPVYFIDHGKGYERTEINLGVEADCVYANKSSAAKIWSDLQPARQTLVQAITCLAAFILTGAGIALFSVGIAYSAIYLIPAAAIPLLATLVFGMLLAKR